MGINRIISYGSLEKKCFGGVSLRKIIDKSSFQHFLTGYSSKAYLAFFCRLQQSSVNCIDYLENCSLHAYVKCSYFSLQENCHNYLRVLEATDDNSKLLLCGSNSYHPRYKYISVSAIQVSCFLITTLCAACDTFIPQCL